MQILGGGFHELIPGGAEVSQTGAVNSWIPCTIGFSPLASCNWCVLRSRLRQASDFLSATLTNVRCVLSCSRLLVNPLDSPFQVNTGAADCLCSAFNIFHICALRGPLSLRIVCLEQIT